MKNVQDHQGFSDADQMLTDLRAKLESVTAERNDILDQLKFDRNTRPAEGITPGDAARRLLADMPLPGDAAATMRDLQAREQVLRETEAAIKRALIGLPAVVERQRDLARAARLEELASAREKIKDAFDQAVAGLRAACKAEDDLIAETIAAGFGWSPPLLTSPTWLVRADLLETA